MQQFQATKEVLRWGGKVETLSRSRVKFLTAICEVRCGVNALRLLGKILTRRGLERDNGRWPFCIPLKRAHTDCGDGQNTQAHSNSLRQFYGCGICEMPNFERFFIKNPTNHLKTFTHFATMLQNNLGAGSLPCFLRV